ncbi:unknown [Clostridium sp. CAG:149]|nr:unknown [Clostridium sp. CAG:149]
MKALCEVSGKAVPEYSQLRAASASCLRPGKGFVKGTVVEELLLQDLLADRGEGRSVHLGQKQLVQSQKGPVLPGQKAQIEIDLEAEYAGNRRRGEKPCDALFCPLTERLMFQRGGKILGTYEKTAAAILSAVPVVKGAGGSHKGGDSLFCHGRLFALQKRGALRFQLLCKTWNRDRHSESACKGL